MARTMVEDAHGVKPCPGCGADITPFGKANRRLWKMPAGEARSVAKRGT